MTISLPKRIRFLCLFVVAMSVLITGEAHKRTNLPVTTNKKAAIIIKGKVTAQEDRMALPGVNISIKGTTVGTTTDADGNYSISVPSKENTLIFSFRGYGRASIFLAG
ncbi:carboxypeptidase-like regulatory domain-containing protein [Spirosoma fluviale]|uniref:carboxypeptidase-like regulatory domain-containing protein n=1 Tax=Spirosoma fluviale TaxID=1597977 RepID=UPI001FE4FE42|nr:carboxypeptidase-like regulatory domain-containing protein [Spirosoma fluviale]